MPEDIDLSRLTPEERSVLEKLIEKASAGSTQTNSNPGPANPGPNRTPEDIFREAAGTPGVDSPRAFGEFPLPNPPEVQRLIPPDRWVTKQIETVRAVGRTHYEEGIRTPRKDPIAAAIAAQAAYEAKMKDPAVLKRREEKLRKTNMAEWAAMAETVGAAAYTAGVEGRRPKIERAIGKLQPLLKEHLSKIDALPDVTDADREKRMLENLRGLKALKGKI